MIKISSERLQELVKENDGMYIPKEFIVVGEKGEEAFVKESAKCYEICHKGKCCKLYITIFGLVEEDKEAIFKLLQIMERIGNVANLPRDDFFMEHNALIKIGQMASLTSVKKALDDLLIFTDEELYDAFLLTISGMHIGLGLKRDNKLREDELVFEFIFFYVKTVFLSIKEIIK